MREAKLIAPSALLTLWMVAGASIGCGGPAKAGGKGADCFRVADCMGGLVCIDHKCTDDVSSIDIHQDATVPGRDAGAD